jgi:nicotinamidase-related amidase
MEYKPTETAVIVVDMQNSFCHPDGELYTEGSEVAISGVNDVLIRAHEAGITKVVFTQDTHEEGDPEFEKWGEHCLAGTWGQELHDGIRVDTTAYLSVKKSAYDAFFNTDLDDVLSSAGIETVIICGTLANVCVQETASTANLLGYDVKVVQDAVGYITEEQKANALDHIDFLIGDIISSRQIV